MKMMIALLVLFLSAGPRVAGAGPCQVSARATAESCELGARDSFWLSVAICANDAAPGQREACLKHARQDASNAIVECQAQNEARLRVCGELGGGAYVPIIDPSNFVNRVDNPYFPLVPGTTFIYLSDTPQGIERDEVVVTHETKSILGVKCTVVRDTLTLNGQLVENTDDWYAQDADGNVWYFGEEAKNYEDGDLVDIAGTWKAGRDGAQPGVIMKAKPAVGDLYRQEFLPATAEDLARVASLDESVMVPYGSFDHCLSTDDFAPLDAGVIEQKFYAPGTGLVLEIDADGTRVELVEVRQRP